MLSRYTFTLRFWAPRPMLADVDCCDPNGLNRIFAGRLVRREVQAYRRKGLNNRQQKIIAQLGTLAPGTSLLDIGCGIGALGTTLLTRDADHCTFVDVSSAYLGAAAELAAEAGVGERASFEQADFATSACVYAQVDVTVLDRVVCCYPNAAALLAKAARHSRRVLLFTYPLPFWFMTLFRAFCALGMRLFGQPYRFFLHDPEQLLQAATSAGHTQITTYALGVWQLVEVSKR